MNSILLVDDEATISAKLQTTLQHFGFRVEVALSIETAQHRATKEQFDAILVDFDLRSETSAHPSLGNGTGLVIQLRASGVTVPILMFTVLDGEFYETSSLNAGADDYILKTTSIPRLLARLHAHIRRHERVMGKKRVTVRRVGIGRHALDRESRIFAVDDQAIELTVREARILEILAANPARIVPCQEILNHVWGRELGKSQSALDGVLKRFRQKLEQQQVQDVIENVKGRGYKLASSVLARSI
jgi:DNA-binding response OmpR family regulator